MATPAMTVSDTAAIHRTASTITCGMTRSHLISHILLVAAGYGLAVNGPNSYRVQYRRRVAAVLAEPVHAAAVGGADLTALPAPVAAQVRHCGAVGEARVVNFRARIHGRIRAGGSKPWMSFTGEQVNTYGSTPSRFVSDGRDHVRAARRCPARLCRAVGSAKHC